MMRTPQRHCSIPARVSRRHVGRREGRADAAATRALDRFHDRGVSLSKGGAVSQLTVGYRHDVGGLAQAQAACLEARTGLLLPSAFANLARDGLRKVWNAVSCSVREPWAHAPCSLFGTRKGCELGSWPRPRSGQEAADVYRLRRRTQFRSRGCDRHRSHRRSQVDPWPVGEFVAR